MIIPNMTPEQRASFCKSWLRGELFTSCHLARQGAERLLPLVFLPIAMIEQPDYSNLGLVWEYKVRAAGQSFSGYPIFYSFRVMNNSDWSKISSKLKDEEDRLDDLEV